MKQTLKQGNYEYVKYLGNGEHILRDTKSGKFEIWFNNKNHASYGLVYKNTHLEFAREQKAQSICNVNDCSALLTKKQYEEQIEWLDKEYGEDLEEYSDTEENGDKFYSSCVDDYDYQFRLITNLK